MYIILSWNICLKTVGAIHLSWAMLHVLSFCLNPSPLLACAELLIGPAPGPGRTLISPLFNTPADIITTCAQQLLKSSPCHSWCETTQRRSRRRLPYHTEQGLAGAEENRNGKMSSGSTIYSFKIRRLRDLQGTKGSIVCRD